MFLKMLAQESHAPGCGEQMTWNKPLKTWTVIDPLMTRYFGLGWRPMLYVLNKNININLMQDWVSQVSPCHHPPCLRILCPATLRGSVRGTFSVDRVPEPRIQLGREQFQAFFQLKVYNRRYNYCLIMKLLTLSVSQHNWSKYLR